MMEDTAKAGGTGCRLEEGQAEMDLGSSHSHGAVGVASPYCGRWWKILRVGSSPESTIRSWRR